MLTRPTLSDIFSTIMRSIEARLTGFVPLLRVAFLRVLSYVFAGSLHSLYGYLDELSDRHFVHKADLEYLGYHGYLWNVPRKAATFSSGNLVFTGVNGTSIPAGTKVQTIDGEEYTTQSSGVIANGFAVIACEAVTSGLLSNILEATELQMTSSIVGIDDTVYSGIYDILLRNAMGTFSVGNHLYNNTIPGEGIAIAVNLGEIKIIVIDGSFAVDSAIDNGLGVSAIVDKIDMLNIITGGDDIENIELWRNRILSRIREQPAGGSVADFKRWAEEVSGVTRAWPRPTYPHPGEVTVIVKAAGIDPVPSSALLLSVQNYLEDRAFVTCVVHTVAISIASIELDISIKPNTEELRSKIIDNISKMFSIDGVPGEAVLITRIYNAISSSGVGDYRIIGIDVDSSPVAIDDIILIGYQYPVLSSINFSTLS